MQIDIGFGDVVTPNAIQIEYPTILEFPAPVLRAYSKETVVAEKLEALTALGTLNSRMKDYYDLWALSRLYGFDGTILIKAINATFERRGTTVEPDPVGLGDHFVEEKSTQWKAFIDRSRLAAVSADFRDVVYRVKDFVHPVLFAMAVGDTFNAVWPPGGPWSADE